MSFIGLAWLFAGMLTEEKRVEPVLCASFFQETQQDRKHANVCKVPLPRSGCLGAIVHTISVGIPRSKEPNRETPVEGLIVERCQ